MNREDIDAAQRTVIHVAAYFDELKHSAGQLAYDFDFDFSRSDRLVCTEVVYRAYDGIGPIHFDLQRRAGRPTLAGADLIRKAIAAEHFQPVAAFAPQFSDALLTGAQGTPILQQAEAST